MKNDVNSEEKQIKGYCLRIPFRMDHGKQISGLEELEPFSITGYKIRIKKLNFGDYHAIIVSTFDTKQEAYDFFIKLRASFLWVSLKSSMGIEYSKSVEDGELPEAQIIKCKSKEIIVEVGYNRLDTVILPLGKKEYSCVAGATLKATLMNSGDIIAKQLEEALKSSSPENVVNDKKLNLAIELYSSSFFEVSANSKFITLVTVLEALTPTDNISEVSIKALKLANKSVKEERNKYPSKSEEYNDIERLLSRIGDLKNQAIGTSMRNYISGIAETYNELGDPETISDRLKEIYNNRSKLLHEGVADEDSIKEGLEFLRIFIPALLEKLYISKSTE